MQRSELETRADQLGVPWTQATTDEELHSKIENRLRGVAMSDGAEAVQDQVDADQEQCHGIFWDFPKAPECKQCTGQHTCFQAFAQTTFPQMQTELGPEATLDQLSTALDVSPEAVLVAQNQQAQPAPPAEPPVPEEIPDPLEDESLDVAEPELDLADADELVDELELEAQLEPESSAPPETEMPKKKKAVKKKAAKKAPVKKAAAKKKAAKKAPVKKAAKKAPTKKPPPVAASEVQDPPQAESVQTAKDSASSQARGSSAPRAKGQAGPAKTKSRRQGGLLADPWGKHTWAKRWRQERQHYLIKKLRPGMKLCREYKGQMHEVTVLKKFYRYNGVDYPTLYAVTKEITGTHSAPRQLTKDGRRPEGTRELCHWSAPKFFALRVLFSKP